MKFISTGRTVLCLLVSVLLVVTVGCASTSISSDSSGNWQHGHSEYAPFMTVIVVAVAPDSSARDVFEQALVKSIGQHGGEGIAAHKYGRRMGSSQLTRDIVLEMVEQTGADAILLTRVAGQHAAAGVSQEETIVHVGPTVRVAQNEDKSMTAVVASNYAVEIVPGTMVIKADTVLESLVYRPAAGDDPVYRATTDAHFEMGPGDHPEEAAYNYALAIGKLLRKDGVIL